MIIGSESESAILDLTNSLKKHKNFYLIRIYPYLVIVFKSERLVGLLYIEA